MQSRVFEFVMATAWSRKVDGGIPRPYERMDDMSYFPNDARSALDERLTPYGSTAGQFSSRLDNDIRNHRMTAPWAVIVLDREYRVAGHVMQIRQTETLPFAPFTDPPQPMPSELVPGVGMIFVGRKQLLQDLSRSQSELFTRAWKALSDCDSGRHWLCCLESLPPEWVGEVEAKDASLFRSLRANTR